MSTRADEARLQRAERLAAIALLRQRGLMLEPGYAELEAQCLADARAIAAAAMLPAVEYRDIHRQGGEKAR